MQKESLEDTGRIEFRGGTITKLVKVFCDFRYINKDDFANILYELVNIFYEYKNETMDLLTDDELIEFMQKSFDGICQGDLDYLEGTVMYKMRENVLQGKPVDYLEESEDYG